MRVLVAPDSFGGTLTAVEAAAAMAAGWRMAAVGDEVDVAALSDGGPGFVDVLADALPGQRVSVTVSDPLGRPVHAAVLVVGSVAYVESAQACGLHLLREAERDPTRTSSYGVGQLLRAALDTGVTRIVVGLGGSGTNDGGAGMLAALGTTAAGGELSGGGGGLSVVHRLDTRELDARLAGTELVAATDVDNPLLGLHGASAVFGPQKGASPQDVLVLDEALTRWAEVLQRDLPAGSGVAAAPGAGAAGGLGAALLALGAVRRSGIADVLDLVGVADRVTRADLVVTGEGRFDFSSLRGKVVAGVAALAAEHAVPCLVLAGEVEVGRREAAAAGVEAAYALVDGPGGHAADSADSADSAGSAGSLTMLAARVAREWSPSGSGHARQG